VHECSKRSQQTTHRLLGLSNTGRYAIGADN
jgi:hypothetical protein